MLHARCREICPFFATFSINVAWHTHSSQTLSMASTTSCKKSLFNPPIFVNITICQLFSFFPPNTIHHEGTTRGHISKIRQLMLISLNFIPITRDGLTQNKWLRLYINRANKKKCQISRCCVAIPTCIVVEPDWAQRCM